MLSEGLRGLAETFERYSGTGGRFIDPAGCRALAHVLHDLVDSAEAIERLTVPPAGRLPASITAPNVVPMPVRRAPPAFFPDGGSAA